MAIPSTLLQTALDDINDYSDFDLAALESLITI
jgi:hypothetical protein